MIGKLTFVNKTSYVDDAIIVYALNIVYIGGRIRKFTVANSRRVFKYTILAMAP